MGADRRRPGPLPSRVPCHNRRHDHDLAIGARCFPLVPQDRPLPDRVAGTVAVLAVTAVGVTIAGAWAASEWIATEGRLRFELARERAHAAWVQEPRMTADATDAVLTEVLLERQAQDAKWGEQNHPSVPKIGGRHPVSVAYFLDIPSADQARRRCQLRSRSGVVSWADVILEELAEAVEAAVLHGDAAARDELVQVAAVAVAWIEAIDRRAHASTET